MHRVYDSQTGQWLENDPIGFLGGDANTRRDVGNDPTNETDPSGLRVASAPVPDPNQIRPQTPLPKPSFWQRNFGGTWIDRQLDDVGMIGSYITHNPWGATKAAAEGVRDGTVIVANRLTGKQVRMLREEAEYLIQTNGGLYRVADASGNVAQKVITVIGVTKAAQGVIALARYGAAAAETIVAGSECVLLTTGTALVTVATPILVYNQIDAVAEGVEKTINGIANGDAAEIIDGVSDAALNVIGLRTGIKNVGQTIKTIAGGPKSWRQWLKSNTSCFAAGTKLWTPDGYRNIEEIQPGEYVYSQDEFDPSSGIEPKLVEATLKRIGQILHLHVEDRVIRTTAEHPFFAQENGWTNAGELQIGDHILGSEGNWLRITDLLDTGEFEAVYNFCVVDWHTYFVGDSDWTFNVWAHNAAVTPGGIVCPGASNQEQEATTAPGAGAVPKHPVPTVPGTPATSPGPDWVWRGKKGEPVGGDKGAWFNPKTGETLHPDLNHPPGVAPHWDWRDPDGKFWRVFPDGRVEPR
jgi:hypothetical protein